MSNKNKDWKKEMQKCKESPVYFYNTYFKTKNQKDLTEDEWNKSIQELEVQRRLRNIKYRRPSLMFAKLHEILYPSPEINLLNNFNHFMIKPVEVTLSIEIKKHIDSVDYWDKKFIKEIKMLKSINNE